jgi:arylsulfatase A-like enzyme
VYPACWPCVSNTYSAPVTRPNIIVVMADDMGFSDLGCYGSEIKTPTIDKLAEEGVRFSQFYNCNKCGPSRASLMTGCYPWQVGQSPGKSIFANLKRNCVTVMQLLKSGGYTTCAVGRLDMVTADDWHDPIQVAAAADHVLGSPSGGPGNYYKEAKGTPWFKDGNAGAVIHRLL